MPSRLLRSLQALLLALLALFLLSRLWNGSLVWYINRRFLPLVVMGAIGMLWLAQSVAAGLRQRASGRRVEFAIGRNRQQDGGRPLADLLLMSLPLLLGVLVPASPLGADAFSSKGLFASPIRAHSDVDSDPLQLASSERTVLDWVRAIDGSDSPAAFKGEPADVTGFVVFHPDLPPDEFVLGRFSLTCCLADAAAVGLVVRWPDASTLSSNEWVRVRGFVGVTELAGRVLPLVGAENVEPVVEPQQPYLYN